VQIEVKGRNLQVTEELRELCEKRFQKIGKQVSDLAVLQVELCEERNPKNPVSQVAEVTLHLKRQTLRAREVSRDMTHAINLASEDMARQVKRHREKRTDRRDRSKVAEFVVPPVMPPDTAAGDWAAPA
jgi:putative sigma-54 modulation protein